MPSSAAVDDANVLCLYIIEDITLLSSSFSSINSESFVDGVAIWLPPTQKQSSPQFLDAKQAAKAAAAAAAIAQPPKKLQSLEKEMLMMSQVQWQNWKCARLRQK